MKMTKDEIRIHQKELRDNLTKSEQERLCEALRTGLFQSNEYRICKMLFTYVSFRSEVDTKEIILQAFRDNKRVFIPRVEKKEMEFYEIHQIKNLVLSSYGILEPQKNEETRYKREQFTTPDLFMNHVHPIEELSGRSYDRLMLLPGLAFDRNGNRIGYGAGYYDRYLASCGITHFYKIALAYDFQVMDQIAFEEYDIKADAILTPTGFIR